MVLKAPLSVFPHRLPFFQQGAQAFLGIFQLEQLVQVDSLGAFESFLEEHPGYVVVSVFC
ncbi:MAG TPA: hypothetical protein VFZ27_07095 [Terriglobia bacterium]|nr:hypothetical protein [Terriglobia bacterium]